MTALFGLFDVCNRAHRDTSTTGKVRLLHWRAAVDHCARWEVWTLYVLQDVIDCRMFVVDHFNGCVNQFTKVVWWNVGRHTHGNTDLTVQKEVWHLRRKHNRLLL